MSEEKPAQKAPAKKITGLGRGLNSLFGDIQREEPLALSPDEQQIAADEVAPGEGLRSIPVSDIRPNPDQPRQIFDNDALDELSDSMKQRGVIQPIVVRPHGKNFQIVAGERRWRAAQRARLHNIPAIVRVLNDAETLEIAIVENVQRRDLNVIEEADAYVKLKEDFGHSQARLAELVGKSRSHVANLMRLLDLPLSVRKLVGQEKLSMGHARALINTPDSEELANQVVNQGLSVRDTEKLARKAQGGSRKKQKLPSANPSGSGNASGSDADIRALETHLSDLLGLKVAIHAKGDSGAGLMAIEYKSLDQLDLICQRLTGEHI